MLLLCENLHTRVLIPTSLITICALSVLIPNTDNRMMIEK